MNPSKIPLIKPCHENWNSMTPNEKGRHCKSCNKTVVDFSKKSPETIQQYINSSTGEVCGKFRPDQVVMTQPYKSSFQWFRNKWMAFAAVFALMFPWKKSAAMKPMLNGINDFALNAKQSLKAKPTIVHGQIRSVDAKKGLSQIEIKVFSGGKEIAYTTSFANGNYFIDIPENTIVDFNMNIEFSHATIVTKVITDVPAVKDRISCDAAVAVIEKLATVAQNSQIQMIEIKTEYMTMGGIGSNVSYSECVRHEIPKELIREEKINYYELNPELTKFTDEIVHEKLSPVTVPELEIKAFPNPTTDGFTIEINNSTNSQIFIYDMSGKLIENRSTVQSREQFSLMDQPTGIYIVSVIDMDTNKAKQSKVIKVK